MIIGLTGGIASGKTSVSAFLKTQGVLIIDADKISRQIVKPYSKVWEKIVALWGKDILLPDLSIDRSKLGFIVFNNKDYLKQLNDITHPEIIREIKRQISIKKDKGILCIDAPLLIETGLNFLVDYIWLIYVSRETQLERLMGRNKISLEEAQKRLEAQMSFEDRKPYAHLIIDNNNKWSDTQSFILDSLNKLKSKNL